MNETKETVEGSVELSFGHDGRLAIIALGAPTERAVTLTAIRLGSFERALDTVLEARPKALLVLGPSLDMFCVGADVSVIQGVTSPEIGADLARRGQEIYNKLDRLPFRTVIAISGPCVGGGCEMALACDVRIISDHSGSVIGLPETKLGILPGWGGTQRLPRLVGLPKALDIILAGKTLRPEQAKKCGLVDEIVPVGKFRERAEAIALAEKAPAGKTISFIDRITTFSGPGRAFVRSQAIKSIQKTTKGFYPAPLRALEIAVLGLSSGISVGLEAEAKALGELIVTPESKALVHIFFLTEMAKSVGKSARKGIDRQQATVIGAGVMGAGIAQAFAKSGLSVVLKDTTEAALRRGMDQIRSDLAKSKSTPSFERAAIAARVEPITTASKSIARSSLVVEAVFEEMSLKKKIFGDLAARVSESCILASNTSSLSVTEMAQDVAFPERVVGMHFFNPVAQMPLVEIIRATQTSDETVAKVAALSSKLGKYPIVVKDVPGFLVNRILVPYLNESGYLLSEGFSVEEIDSSATKFGLPMGPLRLLDEVGLDVASHVSSVMVNGYGERMRGPDYVAKLVGLARNGKKSQAGFYDYSSSKPVPWNGLGALVSVPHSQDRPPVGEIQDRLVLHLVNEAFKCLEEGVAGQDHDHAARQIDLGTVMGIGFPPFLGGVMYYAKNRGLNEIREKLAEFEKRYGQRYAVAQSLRRE